MARQAPVVRTASGDVEGVWRAHTWPDGTVTEFSTFRGIPYAAAPVGDARFDAPRPAEPWDGVRAAHAFGPTPQLYSPYEPARIPEPSIPGVDTLSVNVTTPDPSADAKLPVLMWIHGGGFIAGSAASPWYVGEAFARDGVVTVTASYRLGFEGFGWVDGAVNNRAVLDWIAALTWVRDNISAFGGDPDRVTIAGQSAGGAAVMRLLTLPDAQPLFRAAMAISPGEPSLSLARAWRAAGRVAAAVGAAPYLEAMRDVDPLALFNARDHFRPAPADLLTRLAIRAYRPMLPGPVVDGDVVPQSVDAALIAGVGGDKTLYMGSTAHEFNEQALPFAPLFIGQAQAPLLERAGLSKDLATRLVGSAGGPQGWAVGQLITDATFRCHVANWGFCERVPPPPRGSTTSAGSRVHQECTGLRIASTCRSALTPLGPTGWPRPRASRHRRSSPTRFTAIGWEWCAARRSLRITATASRRSSTATTRPGARRSAPTRWSASWRPTSTSERPRALAGWGRPAHVRAVLRPRFR
ncbi:MAG: carboxylesterase family protein [Demequina sp.]|nr:carboxylesterase family protein [Demequina sp.]